MKSIPRPGRLGAALAITALALGACGGSGGDSPQTRDTAYGQVEGVDDSAKSGTYFWMGIPFAQAPAGALRWKAPVEPAA